MNSYEKNKERVAELGELTENDATWLIAIIAGNHDLKVAWYSRTSVNETLNEELTDEQWERFESTYEWKNLSDSMYDGASDTIHFAVSEYNLLEAS
jgi:hypothetical protein